MATSRSFSQGVRVGRSLRSIPSRLWHLAIDTIYPRTCALCDRRGAWLCDMCSADCVPLLPALCCDRCGHPILHRRCECRSMHPAIVRARAATAYSGWPAASLHKVKYERERDRAQFIAEQMKEPLAALGSADVLIPVPLHADRKQLRGFNQSEVVAMHLSRSTGIKVEPALRRIKATSSQTHLNREQREDNLKGAMVLDPDWKPDAAKHYVLVDDVYTTGATTGACAEQLSSAGVTKLSVLTFVFDLQPRDLVDYRRLVIAASP